MKIIRKIKDLAKKNKSLLKIYKALRFAKDIPLKDFFNFNKMVLIKKVYPYTMVSYLGLSNVYELAKAIEREKIKGAFVECGVWRGGCAAVMASVAGKAGSNRKIWLFDSFEGLPEPTVQDGKRAEDYSQNKAKGKLQTIDKCVASLEDVKEIFFKTLKINPENVLVKKGWFQNTVSKEKDKIGPISILRLDGDWYESTKCCLESLYENVILGGYIILDDYGCWEGAKRALDEFLKEKNIKADLIKIDETGIYFQK